MGKVLAVCRSEKKGIQKKDIGEAFFQEDYGMVGDAHAGKWHRQVSLLSYDKIAEFKARGAQVEHGAFGENLVVEGCVIFQQMGDCIMPREGVFARVLHGGTIKVGDEMHVGE